MQIPTGFKLHIGKVGLGVRLDLPEDDQPFEFYFFGAVMHECSLDYTFNFYFLGIQCQLGWTKPEGMKRRNEELEHLIDEEE